MGRPTQEVVRPAASRPFFACGPPLRFIILLVLWAVGNATPEHAFSQPIAEYQVKAALLYNFTRFVSWPKHLLADPTTPVRIGILGEDPFGTHLEAVLAGKTTKGRPINLRRFHTVQELEFCHILFISASENGHLAAIIESLQNTSALTVSEIDNFTQLGGIIKLGLKQDRIQIEVNVDAALHADLQISSQLLQLATIVHKTSGREK